MNRREMQLADVARLAVMVSNAWPDSRETVGATLAAIEEVFEVLPVFDVVQTVDMPDAGERSEVGAFVTERNLPWNYTVTRLQAEAGSNLSSLDARIRQQSIDDAKRWMDQAREVGATHYSALSGRKPDTDAERTAALDAFEDSLRELCQHAKELGQIKMLTEPLDVRIHKCNTLGYTQEAVAMAKRLVADELPFALLVDFAHMTLNGENIIEGVRMAEPYMNEFHFCNCLNQPGHALHGDHHPPFGEPGHLTLPVMRDTMRGLVDIGCLSTEKRPLIAAEVKPAPGQSGIDCVKESYRWLLEAWKQATQPFE